MKTRPAGLAAIAVAIALIAAGCGGGDDSSTSSTTAAGATGASGAEGGDFVAQANAICAAGNKEINAGFNFGLEKGQQPTQQQLNQVATDVLIPSIQGQIDDIRALTPPADIQDDVTTFLDDAQDALDQLKDDPSLVTQDNLFADVNKEAQAIGLDTCASG